MKKIDKKNYKKAIIDQIMLWMVIFVSFVTLFFFVIDYYKVIKAKDNCDILANYGVRMKALGRDDKNITTGLNNLKIKYFEDIVYDDIDSNNSDLQCTSTDDDNYSVRFMVIADVTTTAFHKSEVHSYAAAFNEASNSSVDCNLTLRIKK